MARAIFLQALGDYLRLRRLIAWIFVAMVGGLFALALPAMMSSSRPADTYTAVASIIVFRIVGLASAVFATAIIGAEVEQKTIVFLLTRPVPRWLLLLMRYLASVLVVVLLCFIGVIIISAAAYKGNPFANPLIARDMLALTLGALAYNGIFLFVSLLLNKAMIVCLLYAFGWEVIVPAMPGTMYYLSIYSHMQAVAEHPVEANRPDLVTFLSGQTGVNTLSAGTATPVLVLIAIVAVGAAVAWFTHFEFVPRDED